MPKTIHLTDPAPRAIRDASAPLPLVAQATVATGLGAEASDLKLEKALAPITLFALRSELLSRLQSQGGRPALSGTSRRAKVPIEDSQWADLEELAALVSAPGCSPSAGQIASVLLGLAVQSVISQLARSPRPDSSPLARDLATRSAMAPINETTPVHVK